ncbi:MAG: hypothetical protein G8345_04090 [Magnetococcales bacterium]|nr:hypothetical protein [Magnetococcales bacterium]NGZ26052.1 hypothetical protein [Magnetococcales bacterium]
MPKPSLRILTNPSADHMTIGITIQNPDQHSYDRLGWIGLQALEFLHQRMSKALKKCLSSNDLLLEVTGSLELNIWQKVVIIHCNHPICHTLNSSTWECAAFFALWPDEEVKLNQFLTTSRPISPFSEEDISSWGEMGFCEALEGSGLSFSESSEASQDGGDGDNRGGGGGANCAFVTLHRKDGSTYVTCLGENGSGGEGGNQGDKNPKDEPSSDQDSPNGGDTSNEDGGNSPKEDDRSPEGGNNPPGDSNSSGEGGNQPSENNSNDSGPRRIQSDDVSFQRPNIDQPINRELAQAVEDAARELGKRLEISSTTGGHGNRGLHPGGNAVDITEINGRRVEAMGYNDDVRAVMEWFRNRDGTSQVFGPNESQIRSDLNTDNWKGRRRYNKTHHDHIHVGYGDLPR